MVLWRISRHLDLSGTGGLRASARWHSRGQPVVYLAETPAGALLEVCIHTTANELPADFTLLRVEGPETPTESTKLTKLPEDGQQRLYLTQRIGSDWLRTNRTALLQVPSAIVPHTSNILLNPLHPEAKAFRIVEAIAYPFDARIKL